LKLKCNKKKFIQELYWEYNLPKTVAQIQKLMKDELPPGAGVHAKYLNNSFFQFFYF
jgi:hypothetical protein